MRAVTPARMACALLLLIAFLLSAAPASAAPPPSAWTGAAPIDAGNDGSAVAPQVAVSAEGSAVAVWSQWDGTRTNIWANRYTALSGWGVAQLLETENAGGAANPQVAVDPSGNAFAVWNQDNGANWNIWANRYAAGSGWDTAQLIETNNSGSASDAQVAADAAGNAVAVWYQHDGTRYNVWANRYAAGSGWGTARLLETNDSGDAIYPSVAVDAMGDAVAAWSQHDGTRNNVWANRYTPGSGWATAQLLETDNAGGASGAQVALDPNGNAIAVWYQSDGAVDNIWANRYAAGTGWGTAQLIETADGGDGQDAQVAMDGAGNAVAVWVQWDGARENAWSNLYSPITGWGTPQLIEADNNNDAEFPQLALDAAGNAVVVWVQWDSSVYDIWANRYTPDSGWGTAQLAETDSLRDAVQPQVGADAAGNAVVVWIQYDGAMDSIDANRWVEAYPPAISLYAPLEGASTNRSTVWVLGTTEPGARVSVSGVSAFVWPDGSFALPLSLVAGANTIEASAWDAAGNRRTLSVDVTFQDPVPGLLDALGAAQAALVAAQTRVASLQASGNATQAQLDAAVLDAATKAGTLAAVQAQVSTLQASLSATSASLTNTSASLAASKTRIDALEAGGGGGGGSTATMVGVLGVLLGAAGLGAAVMMGRRKGPASGGVPAAPEQAQPPAKPGP